MSRFVSGPGVIAAGRSDNSSSRNRAERPARALVLARGPWTSVSVHGGRRARRARRALGARGRADGHGQWSRSRILETSREREL